MTDKHTDHDENHIITERKQKLATLAESRPQAFPNDFKRDQMAGDLQAQYGELEKEAIVDLKVEVSVAGRVMRRGGPFVGLRDVSGRIQFYLGKALQKESTDWQLLDIGDIVGVRGTLSKSGKGELYVEVTSIDDMVLLTKSLRPLPDKFHGLSDQEMKYRQRYVDLITSDDTRRTFQIRHHQWHSSLPVGS